MWDNNLIYFDIFQRYDLIYLKLFWNTDWLQLENMRIFIVETTSAVSQFYTYYSPESCTTKGPYREYRFNEELFASSYNPRVTRN